MLYGEVGDEEERLAFLDKVFEMGCTFWDTAEVCAGYALVVPCCVVLYCGGWKKRDGLLIRYWVLGHVGIWR